MSERSNKGFAVMAPDKQREIASKGGKEAHARGRAHEFTPDQARKAGRKGGEIVAQDRAHMSAIGRAGGLAAGRARARRAQEKAEEERAEREKKEREERWGTK